MFTAVSLALAGCANEVRLASPGSAQFVPVRAPTATAPVAATAAPVTTTIPASNFWSGPAGMLVGVALIAAVALGASAIVSGRN